METKNMLLALDLALSLVNRLMSVTEAAKAASSQGRDLSDEELQRFADADDFARERLADKIAAARQRRLPKA